LEVEDFDVHGVVSVYRDLSPNFIAFAIDYSVAILVIDDEFIPLNEVFPKS
jgi:hypothetical protein